MTIGNMIEAMQALATSSINQNTSHTYAYKQDGREFKETRITHE